MISDNTKAVERLLAKLALAVEADCHQPYLEDNDVGAHDLSVDGDGDLLAVLVDVKGSFQEKAYIPRPQNLLTISPSGEHSLEDEAKLYGGAVMIGHKRFRQIAKNRLDRHEIFITVDYATGAFLYEETGSPAAVAVTSGNIGKVYAALREIFPYAFIISCFNIESRKHTMRKKIAAAISMSGGIALTPRLSFRERYNGLASFNDQAIFYDDRDAVIENILDMIQYAQNTPREQSSRRGGKFKSVKSRAAKKKKKASPKNTASPPLAQRK